MEIRDPLHKHGARVNDEGRLFTESKTVSKIGHVAGDEAESHIVYVRHTVQVAATSEWVGAMWNTDDRKFVISKIFFSAGDITGGTQTFKWEAFFMTADEYTSGGTAFTPLNSNRTSGIVATKLIAYNNDSNNLVLASTVDNTREWLDQRSGNGGGAHEIDCGDAIILGTNTGIAIKCEGSGTGGRIRATIWGYFEEPTLK